MSAQIAPHIFTRLHHEFRPPKFKKQKLVVYIILLEIKIGNF